MFRKLIVLLLLSVSIAKADQGVASYETYNAKPVAENDGDVITTFNVTLDSFTPKLIDAGNLINSTTTSTIPSLRRRTIKNTSSVIVYLSSAAAINSAFAGFGYVLGEASNTATSNQYSTWNTGPIYGACLTLNTSCTVNVLKETISIP